MENQRYEDAKKDARSAAWGLFIVIVLMVLWWLSLDHRQTATQNQKFHAEVENYIRLCEPSVYEISTTPEGINIKVSVQQHNKTVTATMFIEYGDDYKGLVKNEVEDIKDVLR